MFAALKPRGANRLMHRRYSMEYQMMMMLITTAWKKNYNNIYRKKNHVHVRRQGSE